MFCARDTYIMNSIADLYFDSETNKYHGNEQTVIMNTWKAIEIAFQFTL